MSSILGNMVKQFCGDTHNAGLRVNHPLAHRVLAALLSKPLLIATGLSGSGKTKLVQAIARWLTPPAVPYDPFFVGASIAADRIVYHVKKSDSLAIEFWNDMDEEKAIKVVLPRELISEWVVYMATLPDPKNIPARSLREAVSSKSKFSPNLHSFETQLKAAGMAVLNSKTAETKLACHAVIPVGADWTGNENIFGYPDGLDAKAYVLKPALELMLHAKSMPDIPHFLILDEMNLSHVERYFSDVLSALESEEIIPLYQGGERKSNELAIPCGIHLPKNLFIIGTVNVDETTYMFSPKVLDRANVIEFRLETQDLEAFLKQPIKPNLARLDGGGAKFGAHFQAVTLETQALSFSGNSLFHNELVNFFTALQGHGLEFGYRVAHEAARFAHFYQLLANPISGDSTWVTSALDCIVFQKFLPKLHGSRAKLGPLLKTLWFLCVNDKAKRGANPLAAADQAARSSDKKGEPSRTVPPDAPYPLSAEKIGRMWRLLLDNGFTSFAEA